MFKQLLATAAVTICCLGNPAAKAEPTACWLSPAGNTSSVPPQVCDISWRKNANDHTVIDLVTVRDGSRISIVLWTNNSGEPQYAEVFFNKTGRTVWLYRKDEDGDIHLFSPETKQHIWFSVPSRTSPSLAT